MSDEKAANVRDVVQGSKSDLAGTRYSVGVAAPGDPDLIDVAAVLLGPGGRVRGDDDFVFFNNPKASGVVLVSAGVVEVDLDRVPADVDRVLITGSTEAQGKRFGDAAGVVAEVRGEPDSFRFTLGTLTTETVLQVVAFYRRGSGWRLDAVAQGYARGLAAFATEHGIDVGEPEPQQAPAAAPGAAEPTISFEKVRVSLTKDSADRTARIDLRKSKGDPNWILTVGLEWDGRGAVYDRDGWVKRYGEGDLDVYFFCRNEETNKYVVISGESRHRGDLAVWPFMHHYGDSKGPGKSGKPATEQVRVLPNENGDLLVNVYQSVDNGSGAIDVFGKPRVAIRYGRAGADGLPGPDADEVLVFVGNGENAYWATVAHIDVQDGVLTVDGETRYSKPGSEDMPGLDVDGRWTRNPVDGPVGRSKRKHHGTGLTRYTGRCSPSRGWADDR